MLVSGEAISFATVARASNVSTWLVYAEGVREHVKAAILRQQRDPVAAADDGRRVSPASLHADLAAARDEIRELRGERDRLKGALRQQLGTQLDHVSHRSLTDRINELTDSARKLERENALLRPLQGKVHELEKDLAAARTSLRQMIREGNTNQDG
ncbi:hypothetical protein [Streptomyces griseus]|uniref:hypothetical protein n=1 Tax=Streptomyces griseus TaxID=1911 RepID=UPI003799F32F